jgi:2-hydroxyglutarate dehydrogenase
VVGLQHQTQYLEHLLRKTQLLQYPVGKGISSEQESVIAVPTSLLSGDEARELEPDLSPDITCALLSRETGIVDSHTLMESLGRDINESDAGSVVCSTSVVRVDPTENGWVVQLSTNPKGSGDPDSEPSQTDSVLAKTVINSTGLSGPFILNSLRRTLTPPVNPISIWYARGSYASYRGPGVGNVKHLIYPVPETGPTRHGFAGLGTHLTLDLGGNIKFGPDIEWIEPEMSGAEEEAIDFWEAHLNPSSEQLSSMYASIRQYLPNINEGSLKPDYVGIRPKLGPPGAGFQDFVFQKDFSGRYKRGSMGAEDGGVMLTLLGIESPGLTSSLAIGEYVEGELIP